MPERIKILPEAVVNQIAAGEVVQRPASVVKEMMENAVDAGATEITVNFRDGGRELIQIVDNGCGMSPVDARLAFDRHATSKIAGVDDIYSLRTFGFRGEALASIASVAEVEVRTRQCGDELGVRIGISGGKFTGQEVDNIPVGTQFSVRNLFYNVPARRRFLKEGAAEARHITAEFQRVALCNPDVGFSLYNNDAQVYKLPAATLKGRIVGVIGKKIAGSLLEVSADTTIVKIEGFTGSPSSARQKNNEQYLFVNGRYFRSPYFHKAVLNAYEKLIPAGTQPSYFLYLTIDPARIDVNVHPQKTEVKFDDGSAVWQIIHAAIKESLGKLGAVPMIDFDIDSSIDIPILREGATYREPRIAANPDFNPFRGAASASGRSAGDVSDFSEAYAAAGSMPGLVTDSESFGFQSSIGGDPFAPDASVLEYISGEDAVQSSIEVEEGAMFSQVVPLGARYAVTTMGGILAIVDTLRAQEAILYDKIRTMLGSGASVSQQLLFPEPVTLSIDDYTLMKEHADDFAACGFDITMRDDHTVEVSGIPADFTSCSLAELVYDMLDALREQGAMPGDVKADRLAAIMARIGALSQQKKRTPEELEHLMSRLEGCSNPGYTPSGRAVMTLITEEEIKKRLK